MATAGPCQIEYLAGAGGFSGARLWRLTTPAGELCLRCWPAEHPDRDRLQWIHRVLRATWQAGFQRLPDPLPSIAGETIVEHAGHLWEVTPWLPGVADYHDRPSPVRLGAALAALAEFHQAAQAGADLKDLRVAAPSPSIAQRLAQLRSLVAGGCDEIRRALATSAQDPHRDAAVEIRRCFSIAAPRVDDDLGRAATIRVDLQPVIRDVWHDHVLFQGDQVSGIVDFGSLRVDTVALDISRLLGSLVGDDREQWSIGLAAYEQVRPLSEEDRSLVAAGDASTVLLSGMNWLRWLYVDRRQFGDSARVHARLTEIVRRLSVLAARAS